MPLFVVMILTMPFVALSGNAPHPMHDGKCLAQPGSYRALWCGGVEVPPFGTPKRRHELNP